MFLLKMQYIFSCNMFLFELQYIFQLVILSELRFESFHLTQIGLFFFNTYLYDRHNFFLIETNFLLNKI